MYDLLKPPIDYKTRNKYNSDINPSTVHVKNVALQRYFRKYLFQKALSVFKWDLPDTWDKDYFLYKLFGNGYISVFNTAKFGVVCQECSLGGYNLYYHPSYAIVANPLLPNIPLLYIDRDCAIIKVQPDYTSILDIVNYYADQLALASEAMGVNLVNVKTATVFGAENKQQAESYKKMFDNIASGEPAVFIGKELLDDSGKAKWFPFTQHIKESYVVSDILCDIRKIESMFDTEIGIPNANTDKRERLITDEVNANNVETMSRCEMWLDTIKDGVNKCNNMFDINISVDWRVKPNVSVSNGII